ncbi:hypothetical protein EIP91_003801 [Steccherinum ochraceum]|uniref:Uncharacterized protein n=1 Tax=Steccherinum ochraceum TaxID=92696 RepID=A0A4V2MW28_9APHY|nr:hypothetical protein EIP91_003801 [Steccherinum ochraceum]
MEDTQTCEFGALDIVQQTVQEVVTPEFLGSACEDELMVKMSREIERRIAVNAQGEGMRPLDTEGKRQAWEAEYKGHYHLLVLGMLDKMHSERCTDHHSSNRSNQVALVQSQGTGKSRAGDEVADFVFTIPLRLCAPHKSARTNMLYPSASPELARFLTELSRYAGVPASAKRAFCQTFWRELFIAVLKRIEQTSELANAGGHLPHVWKSFLERNEGRERERLFADVMNDTEKMLAICSPMRGSEGLAYTAARSLLKKLREICPRQESGVQLLICVDEARWLSGMYTYFSASLSEFASCEIFTLFIASDQFLESVVDPAVARYIIHPPITEVPFDIWTTVGKGVIAEHELRLAETIKPEFMTRFGRPLFWAYWNRSGDEQRRNLLMFAMKKLADQSTSDVWDGQKLTDLAKLAALNTRLSLEFQSCSTSFSVQRDLVLDHMQLARPIPADWEYFHCFAPSEPILAEAAAQLMASARKEKENVAFGSAADYWAKFLVQQAHEEICDPKRLGETSSRLLLLCARDAAVQTMKDNEDEYGDLLCPQDQLDLCIPVKLFLESLLGDSNVAHLWAATASNASSGSSCGNSFRDAFIRFNYFVSADSSVLTDDAMWAGLSRGLAYKLSSRAESVDIAIPILLKDDKLNRFVVSALFVQVNFPELEHQLPFPDIDVSEFDFFTDDHPRATEESKRRPYLTMVANLGRPTPSEPLPPVELYAHSPDTPEHISSHPRFAFTVNGCTSSAYGVISSEGEHVWKLLLKTAEDAQLR